MPGVFAFEGFEPKKSKKEDERWFSILGVRGKKPSPKKRRGLILRALRHNVLGYTGRRNVLTNLTKAKRDKKDKTKQDPEYFFGLHSRLRRKL